MYVNVSGCDCVPVSPPFHLSLYVCMSVIHFYAIFVIVNHILLPHKLVSVQRHSPENCE